MIKSEWKQAICKADSTEAFYKAIPKNLSENIKMRMWLHNALDGDETFQEIFKEMCRQDPKIFFNTVAWTFNPQGKVGNRNWPFILWGAQEEVVDTLQRGINNFDVGINKSRKEGCTEIITKLFTCNCLLFPETRFIVGSRNINLVDRTGDRSTIFAKIDHALQHLPTWWKKSEEAQYTRTFSTVDFPHMNSGITGETTNENFAAGGRAAAVFLDEFGRVDKNLAESIEGSVHDVAECVIYGSTHWLGINHTFNNALKRSTTTTVSLPWFKNPFKNQGLYSSPDINELIIHDIDYYRNICPEVFNYIQPDTLIKYSSFEEECLAYSEEIQNKMKCIKFIADGNPRIYYRSPWHDAEEEKRAGNMRDFWCNIWFTPLGSSDSPFDEQILTRIKDTTVKTPLFEGEVEVIKNGSDRVTSGKFRNGQGRKRLKWWGKLIHDKPDQSHNYIIGCDPSFGTGSSNSTAVILDVNTGEQVGEWACPNTDVLPFADQVVALGLWCGGTSGRAYLIWENNGGHGINFGRRIEFNHYGLAYSQRAESKKYPGQAQNKWGWHSGKEPKADLIGQFGIALSEGLRRNSSYKSFIIRSSELIDECFDYVFLDDGSIDASKRSDLSSGARERHGDRVIAAGLCVLALRYQPKAVSSFVREARPGSFMWKMQQAEKERKSKKKNNRDFLY